MDSDLFKSQKLVTLLKENDVAVLSLFGSAARNEDNEKSDIDLIVKFRRSKSLLDFERELSRLFGKKVDLVTEKSIIPHLKDLIVRDAIVVYDEKE